MISAKSAETTFLATTGAVCLSETLSIDKSFPDTETVAPLAPIASNAAKEISVRSELPVIVKEANPFTLSAVSEVSFVLAVTDKTPLAAAV